MSTNRVTCFLLSFLFFITSCDRKTSVEGSVDYIGDALVILSEPPIHYKYAPTVSDTLTITEDGRFQFSKKINSSHLENLSIGDASYPLFLESGKNYELIISRADFPKNVKVNGYAEDWEIRYNNYLTDIEEIENQLPTEEEKIKAGEKNNFTELGKQKYEIAENYLADTPYRDYYLKAIGEYLVSKIRAIEYNQQFVESFDPDSAREKVFNEADSLGFFTIESLKAQRAGIRDFAHYYARTFEIYDSVEAAYNQKLAEYDIKRLAYEELNDKRLEVLDYMESRDALAHARMYLVAERIGEQPLEVATPSYQEYLKEFSDYPEYTRFLTNFYERVESVSPGEPAIPFSLPNTKGDLVSMEDFSGKFVLLDFWAGWCQPCLEEFPHMREVYEEYSRDELEIVGISTEEDSLLWRQEIQRFDLPWPQLYGGDGFNQETFEAYQGGGIPFYILVDPDGNIARYNDIRPSFNFTAVLDSLLSERR